MTETQHDHDNFNTLASARIGMKCHVTEALLCWVLAGMSLVWFWRWTSCGAGLWQRDLGQLCVYQKQKSDECVISPALFLCVPLYSAWCCDVCVQEVCWGGCYGDGREGGNMRKVCWLKWSKNALKFTLKTAYLLYIYIGYRCSVYAVRYLIESYM